MTPARQRLKEWLDAANVHQVECCASCEHWTAFDCCARYFEEHDEDLGTDAWWYCPRFEWHSELQSATWPPRKL